MDPILCEECRERALRNKRGDAFNATANPLDFILSTKGELEKGVDDLGECTSSFCPTKSYFDVSLKRCRRCRAIWLLGYYEDFDGLDVGAEWGRRTWIWRPLTPAHIAKIEAAKGTQSLDVDTFAMK